MSSSIATKFNRIRWQPPEASQELAIPMAKIGIEMEVEKFRLTNFAVGKLLPNWDLHPGEGSIRNHGMELVSAGGFVGQQIVDEIRRFCKVAVVKKWSEGYPRAGLHIHMDVTDMNENRDSDLLYLVQSYALVEHALFSFAGEWRRACGFCDGLLDSQADWPSIARMLIKWEEWEARSLSPNAFSKYQALNFLPLRQFGTLEWRHLPQTFDSERIITWINLLLCLKKYALATKHGPISDFSGNWPEKVFGKWYKDIAPHLNNSRMEEALLEVQGMLLFVEQLPLDPWDAAINPLLAMKENAPFAE